MDANERLIRAMHKAARMLSRQGPLEPLLHEVLHICVEAAEAEGGTIYIHDRFERVLKFQHVLPESVAGSLPSAVKEDHGVVGRVFQSRRAEATVHGPDDPSQALAHQSGIKIRSMATVPLMLADYEPIGVVQLVNKKEGEFSETDLMVLEVVSSVVTLAFLNRSLLDQSARAMQLLGMGRVAHDIKNMVAAQTSMVEYMELPIGILTGDLGGLEPDPEVQRYARDAKEMLDTLRGSLQMTMGYTDLLSRLSAGTELQPQLVLEPMGDTVATAASYYQTQCRQRGINLQFEIQTEAPPACHDRMFLFRVVQNLVSNAIKAVIDRGAAPDEQGRIGSIVVRYRFQDGEHVVEVEDTGPGIRPEVVQRILAGQARSMWDKASGTGWGTKIVLGLVQALRGRVEIDSERGHGTTFRVVLPGTECPPEDRALLKPEDGLMAEGPSPTSILMSE